MKPSEPPRRVLFVDDEKNVLRALERTFLDEDLEVRTASSGQEGLEILQADPAVQVVVSDYRMPGMNGVDFLREVCDRWPETIRIVLSGYADTAAIVSAINEGQIYRFVPKPWNDDELKMTIAKALEVYFLHRRNQELTRELQDANNELRLLNENLEKAVEKRTGELLFRNEALRAAQQVFDALPAVVLGIDQLGTIVQMNRMAVEFFSKGHFLIGSECHETLPPEVIDFLTETNRLGGNAARLSLGGREVLLKGAVLKFPDGQAGTVLLLDPIEV